MGVRSSVGRRLSVWKWWEQGAGDTTKLDNLPLTPLHTHQRSYRTSGPVSLNMGDFSRINRGGIYSANVAKLTQSGHRFVSVRNEY